jgi:hypothetical protein
MKNVTSAFEALTGKMPNDQQLQALYKLKQSLGIRDHDALWEVMIALQYHLHLFKETPDAIRKMTDELVENLRGASTEVNENFTDACLTEMNKAISIIHARTQEFEATTKKNITEGIRRDAIDIVKDVSEKEKSRWMTIAFVTCGVAALVFSGVGFWLGSMKGYNDAIDINTKYHWSNSESGKLAFQLYEGGEIRKLATCSIKGWKEEGNICYPHPVQEGKVSNTYGYQMRK